jgi:hypothetical protein
VWFDILIYLCQVIKKNKNMMTLTNLRESAPSIFSTQPSPKMSSRYTFVPTIDIIENFEREGWMVSSAKQVGKGYFSKHQVRLRNQELPNVGDSLVEAIIGNSHNGMSTLQISTGLFRLVCSNGLTVPTSVSDTISIRHSNMDMGEIRRVTDQFAERMPIIQRSVSKMENSILNEEQTFDLLNKAALLRWKNNSVPVTINMDELLVPEREADMGNTVWKTFNVIQEKLIKGGAQYRSKRGRSMTMKSLKDFQVVNKINTELWELAESYC